MKSLVTSFIAWSVIGAASAFATDEGSGFEGTISATLTRAGAEPAHFLFTHKGTRLRIENTANKLEPINLVDLETKKLTIVFPHNTTFVRVDPKNTAGQGDARSIPPNFPMPPAVNTPPGGAAAVRAGPQVSPPPGFPSPPSMPSMPSIPNNSGVGPGAMPTTPMMPPMPGMSGTPELKKSDKTEQIQGFDCTLYTISQRGETFEIWATDDAALPPFRLLQRDYMSRHFGPRMLEEQWGELLRAKSLFPLEATLRMEPNGSDRISFKVNKIEKKKIDDAEQIFSPPKNYYEIQSPSF